MQRGSAACAAYLVRPSRKVNGGQMGMLWMQAGTVVPFIGVIGRSGNGNLPTQRAVLRKQGHGLAHKMHSGHT